MVSNKEGPAKREVPLLHTGAHRTVPHKEGPMQSMGGFLVSERSEDSLCVAQPFCEAEYRHAEGMDMNEVRFCMREGPADSGIH